MKNLWYIPLFLIIISQAVIAGEKDPNNPNKLLVAKWDSIIKVLRCETIDQKEKEEQITEIVSPFFDFQLMAKLSLGRAHWPKLTLSQREKFTCLFVERLKNSYGEKISLYTDEKVLLKQAVQKNKKTIHIPMNLLSKDKNIAMLYKFRKTDKCWKIYDVEIQGVSVILTYRSQFDDILRSGSVDDLFAHLEKPSKS